MKKVLSIALTVAMMASIAMPLTSSAAVDPLTAKAVSKDKVCWTAQRVEPGTTVTLKPDYDEDVNVDRAVIKDGGFEASQSWSDALNTSLWWKDNGSEDKNPDWHPWSVNTEDKIEGNQSGCVDVSPAMASLNDTGRLPIMGFTGVVVEPCYGDEVYKLEFYIKSTEKLTMESPSVMFYILDLDGKFKEPDPTVGCYNVMVDTSMIDYHWYDQNEVIFEDGSNPNGVFKQGKGPFAQGEWVKVTSYFKTPETFDEGAFTFQIQTNQGADTKLLIDAISLEKVTMADVDLGIALKSASSESKVSVKAPKTAKVKKGKKATIKLTVKGAKKVSVTVDKKGKKVVKVVKATTKAVTVKGLKKGKATLTIKAGSKKATCKVTVK